MLLRILEPFQNLQPALIGEGPKCKTGCHIGN
jgi:hypothetical protein